MKIYATDNMEAALQALALIFPHVVLRRVYQNENYIPLRLRKVTGVEWFFYSPAYPDASQLQIERWREGRGILVNTHETTSVYRSIGSHEALLLAECPISLYRIEADSRDTTRCTVIYRPPNWHQHEATLARQCPTVDACRAAYAWMKTRDQPATDEQLRKHTGITCSPGSIRHLLYAHAGLRHCPVWVPIRLHFRPDYPEQAAFYDWLSGHPICTINGFRHVPESALIAYSHRWRRLLKAMKKEHVLTKGELLHGYEFHEEVRPNWEIIGRHHRMLEDEFVRVQALVSAAPDFPHLQILSGQFGSESI